MNSSSIRFNIVFLIAFALTILPLPQDLLNIRPPWILIITLYVQFYLPEKFNLILVLIVGLILDTLQSTVIGEHAFALAAVCWIANAKARRFNFFTIQQQMILMSFFCLLYQSITIFIDIFLGFKGRFSYGIISTISTVVLWPWIRLLVDEILLRKCFRSSI
jgi:rod shape-determining protein MreD